MRIASTDTARPDPEGLQDFRTAVPAAGSGEPAGVGEPEFSMFAWWLLATQGERLLAEGDPAQALVVAEHLNALALRPSHRTHGVPPPQVALLRAGALVQLDPPPSADDLQAAQEALQAVGDNLLARGVRSGLWRVHIARGKLYRAQGQPEAAGTEFAAARALVDELAGNIPPGQLRSQFRERALAQIEPARG